MLMVDAELKPRELVGTAAEPRGAELNRWHATRTTAGIKQSAGWETVKGEGQKVCGRCLPGVQSASLSYLSVPRSRRSIQRFQPSEASDADWQWQRTVHLAAKKRGRDASHDQHTGMRASHFNTD